MKKPDLSKKLPVKIFIAAPADYDPDDKSYPGDNADPQLYVVGKQWRPKQNSLEAYQADAYEELARCGTMEDAVAAAKANGDPKPEMI